tara:strand:+ start:998 stop:1234 length:237 start_codon:yes stop_codon:yes gene_type:complete
MLIFLLLSSIAIAEEPEEPEIVYKKETEIDFEGVDIEGELLKPQGSLVLERQGAHFNPLIKLRKDFNERISSSVEEIK